MHCIWPQISKAPKSKTIHVHCHKSLESYFYKNINMPKAYHSWLLLAPLSRRIPEHSSYDKKSCCCTMLSLQYQNAFADVAKKNTVTITHCQNPEYIWSLLIGNIICNILYGSSRNIRKLQIINTMWALMIACTTRLNISSHRTNMANQKGKKKKKKKVHSHAWTYSNFLTFLLHATTSYFPLLRFRPQ